ncbi:hypothetical protein BKH42_05455 [Helicobacter sp. 13S00482-2]|uniref:prepilin peptidase n=1 Tax=Helicobacter sp. 13S00482-2 TaxID=1476200 RepID=UPI000BA61FF7|nr:prepilin peptidase [Helicobacter sp. 13S00482-2]PAF53496.1 hypothetical protein BKH42_05455 [Helicobacter sp. 13S00482-2]
MLTDFFNFDKSALYYRFLSPTSFGIDSFLVGIFGIGIFVLVEFLIDIQKKRQKINFDLYGGLFFSKIENIVLILLLFLGGLVIGYFYSGIFQIWLMIVFSFLVLLSAIDFKILAVPDWMNLVLFFCILLGSFFFSENFWNVFLSGLGIAGLFSILRIFGDMFCKTEILGEGDIVFGSSIGMLLGVYDTLMSIFWGCVFGSTYSIFFRFFGKKVSKLPFITFISVGLLFCFLMSISND